MSNFNECSFGSYNILNPYHAVLYQTPEGLNSDAALKTDHTLRESTNGLTWMRYSNWEERKETIAENINNVSIACLQEVSVDTLSDIIELSQNYEIAIAAYHQTVTIPFSFSKYGNAIVFNPRHAKLIEKHEVEFICLDKTSRYAVSATFKIADKIIRVMSIHLKGYNPGEFDQESKEASKKDGFAELEAYLADAETNIEKLDGIIIAGDFNEDPSESQSAYYRTGLLEKKGYICDKNIIATEARTGRRIDWIYYKPLKTPESSTTLTSMNLEEDQEKGSDHLITGTNIEWT